MRTPIILVSSSLAVIGALGCANTSGSTNVECTAITAQNTKPAPQWQGTVFTIVMENKSRDQIIGNRADAPYMNALADQFAVAAGYTDNFIHPSEPNYIWMVAGENFGILDDDSPSTHHIAAKSHIADQLEMQGLSWKEYAESMGAPCGLASAYPYEPKHDPFVYFDDINGWDGSQFHPEARCNAHVVDYSELDKDLANDTVPKYVFITPNMLHDMHDASIKTGDDWLSQEVPKILASKAWSEGGVLFLTFDEGDGGADDPPMIVISPNAKQGFVSQTPYNASSYLKTVQKILGVEALPCDSTAASVETMDDLFEQPLDAVAAN
ncbi:MAG TPA: alkaline phosphatase family protein [Kofleriaceae bacterium]|nr:alkaline phosphatase family protein [Kofleriaceae bacterium]